MRRSPPIGLFPLPDDATLQATFADVAAALRRHDFSATRALPFPGSWYHAIFDVGNARRYVAGEVNAYEHSGVPSLYYAAFRRTHADAFTLFWAFTQGEPIAEGDFARLLGADLTKRLVDAQIVVPVGSGQLQSRLLATAVNGLVLFHDTYCMHNTRQEKWDHVFLGRCSTRLVKHAGSYGATRRFSRALDLCTGSGVQSLNVSRFSDHVSGGDINPRAIAFARANAAVNGVRASDYRVSDLFSAFEGRFDLVTANTPFVLLDDDSSALSGYGGHLGMEVELRLFENLDRYLAPGGVSVVIASSVVINGENLLPKKLEEIYRGSGYHVELAPISTYYTTSLYPVYARHDVSYCILYAVHLRKEGAKLALRVRDHHPVEHAAYQLHVATNRVRGWSRTLRGARA